MSEFKNKFSIPPRKDRKSDENVFDFSSSKQAYPPKRVNDTALTYSWRAVSNQEDFPQDEVKEEPKAKPQAQEPKPSVTKKAPVAHPQKAEGLRPSQISMAEIAVDQKMFKIPEGIKSGSGKEYAGQVLAEQNFAKTDLTNANFSATDLTGADFSGAVLRGADFSGANMTDVNLSQADLSGAILAGANLTRANFTGAKLNGVTLTEANLEEAILLGIEIDELGIEELQALIEYMAIYFPHKLNLTKLNLTLLDLTKIDLTKVSLRGVDFTGCSMRGVKIWELDLSECIISPAQIAEALGHPPSPQELAQLLAPKKKEKKKSNGIDLHDLFYDNGKEFGVWDVTKEKGLDIGKLVESGMKLFRKSAGKPKPPLEGEEIVAQIKEEKLRQDETKARNEELKERIMQRKEEERKKLAAKKHEFQNEVSKEQEHEPQKVVENSPEKQKKSVEIERFMNRDRGRE